MAEKPDEMRNWIIKVVIVNKAFPRSWKNTKGSGRVFNFELVDSHNALKGDFEEKEMIQCTAFNDNATKYHKILRLETPYIFKKFIVKAAMFKN